MLLIREKRKEAKTGPKTDIEGVRVRVRHRCTKWPGLLAVAVAVAVASDVMFSSHLAPIQQSQCKYEPMRAGAPTLAGVLQKGTIFHMP